LSCEKMASVATTIQVLTGPSTISRGMKTIVSALLALSTAVFRPRASGQL